MDRSESYNAIKHKITTEVDYQNSSKGIEISGLLNTPSISRPYIISSSKPLFSVVKIEKSVKA